MRSNWAVLVIVAAGLAAAVAGMPTARAAGADATIAELQDQGYLVQINWLSGFDTKPLADCTVVSINDPNHSGEPMRSGDTVYVDVRCPNHSDEGGDVGVGIGFG